VPKINEVLVEELILNQSLIDDFVFDTYIISIPNYKKMFKPDYSYKVIYKNHIQYSKTEQMYQSYLLFWMKLVGDKGIKLIRN